MRHRAGLLAGLLALLVATGVVAQSPSPQHSPLYAPTDMAFQLPRYVGGLVLEQQDGPDLTDASTVEFYRRLLLPLGKEPTDLRVASVSDSGREVTLYAMRVDGVAAERVAEGSIASINEVFAAAHASGDGYEPSETPPTLSLEWRDIAGRRVGERVVEPVDSLVYAGEEQYWYPRGEVLFAVTIRSDASSVAIEDVLAELP